MTDKIPGEPALEVLMNPAERDRRDQAVRELFTGLAGRYDLANRLLSLGLSPFWRRELARRLKIVEPPGRLLDVATGTGDQIAAAKKLRPDLQAVGLDFTPAMLEKARAKFARLPGPAPEIIAGDARAWPFPEAAFDSVSLAFGLRNIAPEAAFYRRILKILKPGGRFLILELCHDPRSPWAALTGFYLKRLLPLIPSRLSRLKRGDLPYLSASILEGPTPAETMADLKAAGFTAVTGQGLAFDAVMLISGDKPL